MVSAFLGIGSNLGNRRKNVRLAIKKLSRTRGIRLIKTSKIIQTKPTGRPTQRDFLNGVIKIKTKLSPLRLLKRLKGIEKELGRKKTVINGPRTIDLDILLYGKKIVDRKGLKIPHPRMFQREFVIKSLLEVI